MNGWHRLDGDPDETCNSGDGAHEVTIYYAGDDGRFAEETYYLLVNPAGKWSVEQMSHVGRWDPNDPEHEGEPLYEEYLYSGLGLYDYPTTSEGLANALRERDRFASADESDSYTF